MMTSIALTTPKRMSIPGVERQPSYTKARRSTDILPPLTSAGDAVSRENTMPSTRTSRRGNLRDNRTRAAAGVKGSLSRDGTQVTTLSNQQTRASKRKGSVAMRNLEEELKKAMPKGWNIREGFQALAHFRKIVRFVIVFMKWIMAMREEAEKTGGGGSEALTELATQNIQSAMVTADGTTFDVADFQSKKEILLSSDVREILNQHPTLRSKDQIQLAKYGLQHVQSFSEYPLHMQEKLSTVAYFQEIDAKRVILREGHIAETFYFILSGSAVSTKLVKNESLGTVELKFDRILSKGDSFGEMELLHHSNRESTVVSQTPMTLLSVARDRFFDIFMASQDENSLPDHIKFLSTLEIMKGFPVQALADNQEKCLLHFFRRGTVILEDSLKSDWLYFIKSGTCQVLKELKGLTAKQINCNKSTKPTQTVPTDFSLSLPRLGNGAQSSRTDNGLKSRPPPKATTPRDKIIIRSSTPPKGGSNFLEGDFLSKQDDHLPLLMMEKRLVEDHEYKQTYDQMVSNLDIPIDRTTPHRTVARNSKMNVGYTHSKYATLTVVKNKRKPLRPIELPPYALEVSSNRKPKVTFQEEAEDLEARSAGSDRENTDQGEINQAEDETDPNADMRSSNENLSVSTFKPESDHDEKDAAESSQSPTKRESTTPAPVYVQVELLKPRDVFGLTNIKFDDFMENKSLPVSLVSRGAECIMVEKRFFIEHATQEVRHQVMSLVRPYPDLGVLQGNLEIKAGWENYRDVVLQMSQDRVAERKELLRKTQSIAAR